MMMDNKQFDYLPVIPPELVKLPMLAPVIVAAVVLIWSTFRPNSKSVKKVLIDAPSPCTSPPEGSFYQQRAKICSVTGKSSKGRDDDDRC